MRRSYLRRGGFLGLFAFLALLSVGHPALPSNSSDSSGIPERAITVSGPDTAVNIDYTKIPVYFIQNKGQVHPDALYYAAAPAFTLWVTGSGLVFDQVRESGGARGESRAGRSVSRLIFLDSNPNPKVSAAESSACRVNYFRGQDQSGWITDIPTSQAVVYKNGASGFS
ncbi:MAG: hypothetical protein MUQ00_03975, partial [Candidatus Aminicenantes bacterium]|nr:hypothetical protein [Candidatus Aminicenantes bacterium]